MLNGLWVALSTYSRVPAKRIKWTDESLRYSLCFFPLVGVIVGAAEFGWLYLAAYLKLGAILTGAVGCAIPLLITGGIHMDGFMDTLDALSSRKPQGEMLKILKDSHSGAFAAMGCAAYLILQSASLSEMPFRETALLSGGFVLSRALSAFFVAMLPAARKDGMAKVMKDAAQEKGEAAVMIASVVWVTVFLAAMLLYAPIPALILTGWAVVAIIWYLRVVRRFGGVTGDLAGWFLMIMELGFALSLALGGKLL